METSCVFVKNLIIANAGIKEAVLSSYLYLTDLLGFLLVLRKPRFLLTYIVKNISV